MRSAKNRPRTNNGKRIAPAHQAITFVPHPGPAFTRGFLCVFFSQFLFPLPRFLFSILTPDFLLKNSFWPLKRHLPVGSVFQSVLFFI
jgi:hypothetical protein